MRQKRKEETDASPAFDREHIFSVRECTANGGVRGVFGEEGWNGTISQKRLEGIPAAELVGRKLWVLIDRKNATGDGYALVPKSLPHAEQE